MDVCVGKPTDFMQDWEFFFPALRHNVLSLFRKAQPEDIDI
jgi:hypothetical protein